MLQAMVIIFGILAASSQNERGQIITDENNSSGLSFEMI
jgi:hypothetical protein